VEYSLPWGVDAGEARRRNFSSCRLTGSRLWAASIVGLVFVFAVTFHFAPAQWRA
jgi:hypothetical protein